MGRRGSPDDFGDEQLVARRDEPFKRAERYREEARIVSTRYLIILSRDHAEELLPHAGPRTLERIEKHVAACGAVIIELGEHGIHRMLVAENGVQVANRMRAR